MSISDNAISQTTTSKIVTLCTKNIILTEFSILLITQFNWVNIFQKKNLIDYPNRRIPSDKIHTHNKHIETKIHKEEQKEQRTKQRKKTDIPKAPAKIRKQEHIQEVKGRGKKENIE